jgi:hypothetical protein
MQVLEPPVVDVPQTSEPQQSPSALHAPPRLAQASQVMPLHCVPAQHA